MDIKVGMKVKLKTKEQLLEDEFFITETGTMREIKDLFFIPSKMEKYLGTVVEIEEVFDTYYFYVKGGIGQELLGSEKHYTFKKRLVDHIVE